MKCVRPLLIPPGVLYESQIVHHVRVQHEYKLGTWPITMTTSCGQLLWNLVPVIEIIRFDQAFRNP